LSSTAVSIGSVEEREKVLDHIILTVSDFERSVAFYAKALKPLGITNFLDYEGQDGHPDLKGFGDGKRAFFWLKEGKPDPQAVHVGFVAKDHAEVDASTKRLWKPEARAKKHLKLGSNTIPAIMRHGCSILMATISRSFIKAKFDFHCGFSADVRVVSV
jgi:catechol 2,3-dioxygenase-like lactoylglutathione lyase family enzyme